MTPFAALLDLAGLSQREAASFLEVSPSLIDKMARGARSTSDDLLDNLKDLIERQEVAAFQAIDLFDEMTPDEVEIGYPADDHEAKSLGWPCVGAWKGMVARIIASTTRTIVLVPRGSTPATAAAIDAHEGKRP